MDVAIITIIGSTVVTIIGAITLAVVTIIKALRDNTAITVAGQVAGAARGVVRDKRIQEIHILTNGRLTAALKLIMVMSKKEWLRTNSEEDKATYESALAELTKSEDAIHRISVENERDMDVVTARMAETKLASLISGVVEANDLPSVPIIH
jgi:hypothetical protein